MRRRNPAPKPEDLLRTKAAGWERRRRILCAFSLSLDGLMVSLTAGILFAFAAQLFPIPFHSGFVSGGLVVLGFLICGGIGFFRPSEASVSLLAADRRLGLKERLSTAYELLKSSKSHPFTSVLAADAASHARDIQAKDVHPLTTQKRWRLLPLLTAVLLVVSLVDFGISSALIGRRDPELAGQGKTLEDLGKKLASRATRDFLPETLRLAQEMERLGNELQRGELSREDAVDQMNELADQAEERAQQMQQQMDQSSQSGNSSPGDSQDYTSVPLTPGGADEPGEGEAVEGFAGSESISGGAAPGAAAPDAAPSGGGSPGSGASSEQPMPPDFGLPDTSDRGAAAPNDEPSEDSDTGSRQSDRQNRQEIDNLDELEQALRDSVQQLAMVDAGEGNDTSEEEQGPSDSESSVTAQLRESEESSDGSPGGLAPGSQSDGGEPGTEAAQDEPGESSRFAGLSREDTSEIESIPDEGDTFQGVLRALPLASAPQKPLEDVIADYSRQLEETIDRESVPLNYRQYIRDYFVVIGILGEGTE